MTVGQLLGYCCIGIMMWVGIVLTVNELVELIAQ